MELTYEEEKLERQLESADRYWKYLALGLTAAVVGMLMVLVASLALPGSY